MLRASFLMVTAALIACLTVQSVYAQRRPPNVRPNVRPNRGRPPQNPGQPNANPNANKNQPNAEKDGKQGEQKKDEKKEEADSIKRPEKPPQPPDPREFQAKPNEDGLVEFNFYGQAWPDLVQWLAQISNQSLDWQELPKDYVNITTTRPYTVPEIHDLFNRLLLERGFTMVEKGRILSVNRISKLDPSLLTRVEDESELHDLPAHQFVKVAFQLPDELKADQAAADVKPLLSPHAKVHPLVTTNRLLIIDAVTNLREVSQLINTEHAAAAGHVVPKEFKVHFARADRVADQVMVLLGLDPSSRRTPQELQLEQQRLQLFQQMQQRGKDVTKYLRKGDGPKVFLAVNDRNNSILVNAPAAELRVISRAIEHLDVPMGAAGGSGGAISSSLTLDKYELAAISPQSVISALEEIGNLDPRTRLRADTGGAKILIANATSADHLKIQSIVDSLDGTGRELEVIWLRRLPAVQVAETLHKLIVGEKEEEDQGRNYFFSYRYRNRNDDKPKGEFRVDADVERNRLLLWATQAEMKEVRKFLEKLGEIPGRSGNPHTVRFLEPRSSESLKRLLREMEQVWDGPNRLKIEVAEPEEAPETKPAAVPQVDIEARRPSRPKFHFVAEPATEAQDEVAPPIIITIRPNGQIVLRSDDTAALDRLEDLLSSLTPPAPNYKVFYLKYAFASMVTLNLEEYFEEEGDFDTQDNWMRAYWGMNFESSDNSSGLSSQKKLRFIYDIDTNSVLVANASPAQLETCEALIAIYDKPPSEDSISARSFKIFKLNYAQALDVAKTIKEVYRDLLSSKDKDFAKQGEQKQASQTSNYYRIYGGTGDDNSKSTKVKASFEGALSVGVNQVSNTLIVSAQEEWMPSISAMIEYLDQNAEPDKQVSVQRVTAGTSAGALRETLNTLFGETPKQAPKPNQNQQNKPPQQPGANPNQNR